MIFLIFTYYIFYQIIKSLKVPFKEIFKKEYIIAYLMNIYVAFFLPNYLVFSNLIIAAVLSMDIIKYHPYFSFQIENSNYSLIFFGFLLLNIIFRVLGSTMSLLTSLV